MADGDSGSGKVQPTPTSTFLIFATVDGTNLRRVGKVDATSADQAVRKHVAESDDKITAETKFPYLAAISANYFKLRKPAPKVVTSVSFEDVDWDDFKEPEPLPQADAESLAAAAS